MMSVRIDHAAQPPAVFLADREDLGRACANGEPAYDLGFTTIDPQVAELATA